MRGREESERPITGHTSGVGEWEDRQRERERERERELEGESHSIRPSSWTGRADGQAGRRVRSFKTTEFARRTLAFTAFNFAEDSAHFFSKNIVTKLRYETVDGRTDGQRSIMPFI